MIKTITSFIFFIAASTAFAADQVLIISGGDNPGLNHYSQYLQTKTLYDFLAKNHQDTLSIYFGAGNNDKTQAPVLDVHKIETINNVKTDVMLPGIIANNSAATKANVSNYFFSTKAQNLTSTDNLVIFVSDHGLTNSFDNAAGPYANNCIDLWNFNGTLINNWLDKDNFYRICLSKNELTTLVSDIIHPKHVIFVMSQCYSGGFHQMSVTMQNGYPSANGKICGFTSAPPDHYASGCTADASGPSYQGYERYFTEWFTGVSVPTGKPLRPAAKSIFAAHQNALLEDMTVDIPLTTSDYYLWQWANLFESPDFVSRLPNVSETKVLSIYNNYKNYIANMKNDDFSQFLHLTAIDSDEIRKRYPNDEQFFSLSLPEQQKYIDHLEQIFDESGQQFFSNMSGMMNIYRNIIFPEWEKAIKNKQTQLMAKQIQIEENFYSPISKNGLYNFPYQLNPLFAQYLSINHNDQDLTDYYQHRYNIIKQWAAAQNLPNIKNAVEHFALYDNTFDQAADSIGENKKEIQLLKRIYIYNKIIAAWVTLQQVNDSKALADLAGLLNCEHSV